MQLILHWNISTLHFDSSKFVSGIGEDVCCNLPILCSEYCTHCIYFIQKVLFANKSNSQAAFSITGRER